MDILYLTLPVNRKSIVIGRYTFVFAMEIIGVVFVLLFSFILSAFLTTDLNKVELYFLLSILFATFSLMKSIQYPIYFKFGYTKGKILSNIPVFILAFAIIIWSSVGGNLVSQARLYAIQEFISESSFLMYGVPVGVGFLLLISSSWLYENKDL